jgi:hypothetical protein
LCEAGGGWSTYVANFKVQDPASAKPFVPSNLGVYSNQGRYLTGSVASIASVDGNYYQVETSTLTGVGDVASAQATFTSPFPAGGLDSPVVLTAVLSGPLGATGQLFAVNQATGVAELITAAPLGNGKVTLSASVDPKAYLTSGNTIKLIVRATYPSRFSRRPFVMQLDEFQVLGYPKQ